MALSLTDQLAEGRADHASYLVSGNDNPMVTLSESPAPFLSLRPEWTVNGALLKTPDGRAARVMQSAFSWIDGAWQAGVVILPIEASQATRTMEIKVRVTPDTLRRWAEVGINPFLEACAQLEEYWRVAKPRDATHLTWL